MSVDCNIIIPPLNQPPPDTCPALPGLDPVLNFMNYVRTDRCLIDDGEFTCGQIERMYMQWKLYREEQITQCPTGEMEIEFAIEFDARHEDHNNRFGLYKNRGTSNEVIILDSAIDHDPGAFELQDIVAVDLCVPQDAEYQLEITDSNGDGFSQGGEVLVYRNTQLLASQSGNFGSVYTVVIPPLGPAPTAVPTRSPTLSPTGNPTGPPTEAIVTEFPRTSAPTSAPTGTPTRSPTNAPTAPTVSPTSLPTTGLPTIVPRTISPTPERHVRPMKSQKSPKMSKLGSSKGNNNLRPTKKSSKSQMKSMSITKKTKSLGMDMTSKLSKTSKSKGKGTKSAPSGTASPSSVLVPRPPLQATPTNEPFSGLWSPVGPAAAPAAPAPAVEGGDPFVLWSPNNAVRR